MRVSSSSEARDGHVSNEGLLHWLSCIIMVKSDRQIATQGVHHQSLRELGTSLQPHPKDTKTLQLVIWKTKGVRQNMSPSTKTGFRNYSLEGKTPGQAFSHCKE